MTVNTSDKTSPGSATPKQFTTEEKLQHEVKYLQERVTNLEVFKKNFFAQHYELIEAREKITLLEDQVNLNKVKNTIVSSGTDTDYPVDDDNLLLDYFHNCLTAHSFQDLVMSLFQSVEDIATNISLMIRDSDQDIDFSSSNSTTDANLELIKQNYDNGEVVNLGEQTILNYKHISLIYTANASDTPEQLKQFHDFMEIITLGANSRVSHIKQHNELEQLRKNIYQIFKRTNKSFQEMQDGIDENTVKVSTIYEDCRTSIITHMEKMKIDERNAALIKLILDESRSELLIELTSAMSLDQNFLTVMKKLESAYAKEYAE